MDITVIPVYLGMVSGKPKWEVCVPMPEFRPVEKAIKKLHEGIYTRGSAASMLRFLFDLGRVQGSFFSETDSALLGKIRRVGALDTVSDDTGYLLCGDSPPLIKKFTDGNEL